MDTNYPTPIRYFLPTAIILAGLGWAGLAVLFFYTLPTVGPRWLFFFLSVLALTGTFLPGVAFLNLRFPSTPPVVPGIVIREAIWFGVYGSTLAWLQIGRVLTLSLALLLGIGLVAIELLLRLRERSQWRM